MFAIHREGPEVGAEVVTTLLKACNKCGTLIQYGRVYCSICGPIVEQEREARRREAIREGNRRYNTKRDPKYGRFYNSIEWRTLSRRRLQDDRYRCVMCGGIASEVDHILPIQTDDGWKRRLDITNTRSLCLDCHNKRHERFGSNEKKKKYRT